MEVTDFFLFGFVAVFFLVIGCLIGILLARVLEPRYRPETALARPEKPRKPDRAPKRQPVAITEAMAAKMELEEQGRNRL